MEIAYVERFERRVMPREEFDRLPEKVRAEYVDGVALVAPPGECLEGIRRIGAFARSL